MMLWLLSGGLLKHGWNKDSDARLTAGEFSHYLEQILDIGSPSRQAYGGWKEALLLLLILDCGGMCWNARAQMVDTPQCHLNSGGHNNRI